MAKIAPLKILFFVVNSDMGEAAKSRLASLGALFGTSFLARGVSKLGFLDLFGLGNFERTVILSVVPTEKASEILKKLHDEFELDKEKKGIAFLVSLSAISRDALNFLLEEKSRIEKREKEVALALKQMAEQKLAEEKVLDEKTKEEKVAEQKEGEK